MLLKRGGGGGRVLLKTLYDASYSVVQGVGARRVGDVRRVGRCRGPTRRKIPIWTVVPQTGVCESFLIPNPTPTLLHCQPSPWAPP